MFKLLLSRYLFSIKALTGLFFFVGTCDELTPVVPGASFYTGAARPDAVSPTPGRQRTIATVLNWVCVDSLFQPLPGSVSVYRTTDSLDGKPNVAYYVQARLGDRSLNFTTQVGYGKRHTPSEYFQQEDSPLLVVNGTFFSFADNRNLNLVITDGNIVAHNVPSVRANDSASYNYPFRGAIGINRRRRADVAWVFTDTGYARPMAIQRHPVLFSGADPDPAIPAIRKVTATEHVRLRRWKNIITAIAGGPVLVQQGAIAITNEQELMFTGKAINDKHPRTAMGYTKDGKLIILVVQGRSAGIADGATLEQEARILADIGCHEAVNLDGGGSSCMLVNGRETIHPSDKEGQRPVPAVFMIRRSKENTP